MEIFVLSISLIALLLAATYIIVKVLVRKKPLISNSAINIHHECVIEIGDYTT